MINHSTTVMCDSCYKMMSPWSGCSKRDVPSIVKIKDYLAKRGWLVRGKAADEIKTYCPKCRMDIGLIEQIEVEDK